MLIGHDNIRLNDTGVLQQIKTPESRRIHENRQKKLKRLLNLTIEMRRNRQSVRPKVRSEEQDSPEARGARKANRDAANREISRKLAE